jgi:hypothetical protein
VHRIARQLLASAVMCNPKRQHDRQKTNRKMKEKMPTLQQNQKSCIPTLIANAMQHICFYPNAPWDNYHGLTERQGIKKN